MVDNDLRESWLSSLTCAWEEPVRFGVPFEKAAARRVRSIGRRIIQLAETAEPISFHGFVRGQVHPVKREVSTNHANAVQPGQLLPGRERRGKGACRVAPRTAQSSSCLPSRLSPESTPPGRVALPRSRDFRLKDEARRESRATVSSDAFVISIARTTTRRRPRATARQVKMISVKQICPGGQRPDRLRAGPSDEVKFSVSSPRSRKSTAPRNRPRHFDL